MLDLPTLFTWSPWYPLDGCWRGARIPHQPGLYRIRRSGRDDLDYIGQTGAGTMTLRKRLAMLVGVYAADMPYRDPHTAAPALWALRHQSDCHFEVSVVPIEGTTPHRKGLEALAISAYRQDYQHSPTINFGRMPPGYRMSSANNLHLVTAGLRFRGSLTDQAELSHLPSIAPIGLLTQDIVGADWCGHHWSPWVSIQSSNLPSVSAMGLYRIRHLEESALLYIGQGRIGMRLRSHLAKIADPEHPQGRIFANQSRLLCSWVTNADWKAHQLLELENDLIAAHVLFTRTPPIAQFLG